MKPQSQKADATKTNNGKPANQTTTLVVQKTNEPETNSTTNEKPQAEIKPTVDVQTPRVGEPKSVKDIIEKHSRIAKCLEKRASIDEASKTLDSFNLGSSKIKDTLTIEDGKGNTFETSKTDLIEDVINLLKQRVEIKNAEVDAELLLLEAA